MSESKDVIVRTEEYQEMVQADNDLVPDRWKGLFNNEEWLMHDMTVKSVYGFMVIAIIAHTLVYIWEPWLGDV